MEQRSTTETVLNPTTRKMLTRSALALKLKDPTEVLGLGWDFEQQHEKVVPYANSVPNSEPRTRLA